MKVTVVIPTYNSAHFLPRAIKSVLKQSMQDFEIFIVDDASTDKTPEIVQLFVEHDDRVHYERLQKNSGGAAVPKNVAIQQSDSEFIAVLDADDEWLPAKLEQQLELFQKNVNLGFVSCNEWIVSESGQEKKYRIPRYEQVLNHILESDYMGGGSCTMYRRSALDRVGLFDEKLNSGQDWDMRIQLVQEFDFDFVDGEPLIKRYLHEGNISKMQMVKKEVDLNYIQVKHQALYDSRPLVFSNKLRFDGTRFLLAGHPSKARTAFMRSIRINPFNVKSYLYLLISFFGRRVYDALTQLKRAAKSSSI